MAANLQKRFDMGLSKDVSDLIMFQRRYDRFKTENSLRLVNELYERCVRKYTNNGALPVFAQKLAEAEYKRGAIIEASRK